MIYSPQRMARQVRLAGVGARRIARDGEIGSGAVVEPRAGARRRGCFAARTFAMPRRGRRVHSYDSHRSPPG
jgi:hypothetical protein